MRSANKNLPPPAQFTEPGTGLLTRQANNFLNAITASSNVASAGDIATPPGSGLEGGGTVADGVTLSIAPNGVTNAMIRDGLGTSVIGRYQNSTGDVADIKAVQSRTALQRQGDQLAFFPYVNVPDVICDTLEITPAAAAEVIVCTHTFRITLDGVEYKVP